MGNVIVSALSSTLRPRAYALLLLALTLALAACGGSAAPSHPHARRAAARVARDASALVSIFEISPGALDDPGPVLDRLRRLGVQYVRVALRWRGVAPDPSARTPPPGFDAAAPGAYPAAGWSPYDAIDRAAQARHMGVLFNITGGAPRWASGPGAVPGGEPGVWRPSPSAFAAFVRAVGRRYSGRYRPPEAATPLPRVSLWSIWNEPNLGEADLAPQATDDSRIESSAVMYRQLLDAGWSALHATGHGADTILIGELAPLGQTVGSNVPGVFGEMAPLRFVRALYCVDASLRPLRGAAAIARDCPSTAAGERAFAAQHPALFDASGFAVHPYPGPTRVPPTTILGPDFANLANLPKLERMLRQITAAYGRGRPFPIWNTEYGYITDPPFAPGAPLALAAAYENQAEYMSWRMGWMRSFDHYLLLDPPPGGPSHFFTGLLFADGTPKPTYQAFRLALYLPVTRAARGQALEVWGCVRPANTIASPPPASIQLQPRGRTRFLTVATVPLHGGDCYFDVRVRFPSAGIARVAWTYPGGQTVYSRQVAVTVG